MNQWGYDDCLERMNQWGYDDCLERMSMRLTPQPNQSPEPTAVAAAVAIHAASRRWLSFFR
jgi:hypothetical protein